MIWKKCSMDTFFHEGESDSEPCVVKITDDEILVEYGDPDYPIQYRGRNLGTGHFDLACAEMKGRATLHLAPKSKFLEGSWIEDSYTGMWRIELR